MAGRTRKITLTLDDDLLDWAGKNFRDLGFKSTSALISDCIAQKKSGPPLRAVYTPEQVRAGLLEVLHEWASSQRADDLPVSTTEQKRRDEVNAKPLDLNLTPVYENLADRLLGTLAKYNALQPKPQ